MSEVSKIQAVQRSLAIAQRVTSSALVEAKKHRAASPAALTGGKKHKSSPKRKASPAKKSGKRNAKKKSGKK